MPDTNAENIGQVISGANTVVQNNYVNQTTAAELPDSIPSIGNFIGREDYLNELRRAYGGESKRSFVLHGVGGVGKTATALRFAGEIAGDFAAKLFVEMQGLSENPLSAQGAMLAVVRQFERTVPADISAEQLKNLFVQFTQKQSTLIFLDNAGTKESIEPLQQSAACLIVTSRESFVLTGGKSVRIEQMSPADARNLLFEFGGGMARLAGEADNLASLAGYLPMALKPLAALLAEDELETAAGLVERYRDKQLLFKERVPDYNLTLEQTLTVGASFELSYEKLSDKLKEHWRLLSVFPDDFDQAAITAILNISDNEAKETQKQLRRRSLLEVNAETKRFNLHDLIRVFNGTKLLDNERFQAQFRFAKHYASMLWDIREIEIADLQNGFSNALKRLDSELSNIKAGQLWTAKYIEVDKAIAVICTYYSGAFVGIHLRLHPREYIVWQNNGLKAAQQIDNKQIEGNKLGNLGNVYNSLGEYRTAIEYHQKQLEISRNIGDKQGESNSLSNLGIVYDNLGDFGRAIDCFEQSLKFFRDVRDRLGEAASLCNLGITHSKLGELRKAIDYQEQSLKIQRDIGNRLVEGNILSNLGNIYHRLGEFQKSFFITSNL
jgi:tetratricopeptide (TPR) repeat protein